jgi:hypothetical protein
VGVLFPFNSKNTVSRTSTRLLLDRHMRSLLYLVPVTLSLKQMMEKDGTNQSVPSRVSSPVRGGGGAAPPPRPFPTTGRPECMACSASLARVTCCLGTCNAGACTLRRRTSGTEKSVCMWSSLELARNDVPYDRSLFFID